LKTTCLAALTILAIIAILGTTSVARAQSVPLDKFEALEHECADGGTLLYRLLKPTDSKPGQKHPLLIFLHGAGLHGAGERGNDNKAQLLWGARFMLDAAEKHGCYVLVPQCPRGKRWVEVDWNRPSHAMPEEPSESIGLLMERIAEIRKELPKWLFSK